MAAEASCAAGDARIRLLCSHGGRLRSCSPDGALRYVGGETRVLVLPRSASFRDLTARLAEMAGVAEVCAVMHRLADVGLDDVLVSVTCDEELAHMRDEYDRLRATRPAAGFRVFVSIAPGSGGCGARRRRMVSGLPPLAPKMRCVQSEQALAARAKLYRRPASPAPMRRVQSAQELAAARSVRPTFYHRGHHCRCCCQRRDLCAPAQLLVRPMYALPYMSKNVNGVRSGGQEPAPAVPATKATRRVILTEAAKEKARSRDAEVAMEKGRAIWEFE